ncbi:ABC transporter substrate-binding protein [Actinomyces sp. 2119]|nr:ABC transporter substrate-binding protein [Actinomyces sp. 2119]
MRTRPGRLRAGLRRTTVRRRDLLGTAGHLASLGVVASLAGRGAWQAAGAPGDGGQGLLGRPLRVGYLPVTDAAALLVAHHRGLWEAAGVASAPPVLFRSWDAVGQALVVGEVDVVHMLLPMALQLRLAQEAPVRVVAWGHTNGSAMVTSTSVTETARLAGRRLAVPYWWSIHSVLSQHLVAACGLRPVIGVSPGPQEVELVVMPPAEMVSALASGSIAGMTVADPFGAVAELEGAGRVHRLLGDVWRDHACCGVVVRQELIDTAPDAVHALLDGLVMAQDWLEAHRQEAAELLTGGGWLPQSQTAVARALQRPEPGGVSHPDWHGERLGFSAFPHPSCTEQLVRLLGDTAVDGDRSFLERLDPVQAHDLVVDDRFVRAALERVGRTVPPRREEVSL